MDRATRREFNRRAAQMVQKHANISVQETWQSDGSVVRKVTVDESNPQDGDLLLKMLSLSPAETEEMMDQAQGMEQAAPSPEAIEMEADQAPGAQIDDQQDVSSRVQTGKKKVKALNSADVIGYAYDGDAYCSRDCVYKANPSADEEQINPIFGDEAESFAGYPCGSCGGEIIEGEVVMAMKRKADTPDGNYFVGADGNPIQVGDRVNHPDLGDGTVDGTKIEAGQLFALVRFDKYAENGVPTSVTTRSITKNAMKRKAADIKNRNDLFNELEKSQDYRNTHAFEMNNGDIKSFEEMDEMFNNKDGMTEEYFPIFTFEKTAMKKKAGIKIKDLVHEGHE